MNEIQPETILATEERSEPYLTTWEATKLLPRRVTASTILRWGRDGVRCRNGQYVFLRHIRIGGRVMTTKTWIQQFLNEQAEANALPRPQRPAPPAAVYTRSHAEADARLRDLGI